MEQVKMTKAELRVAIAKDVIKSLRSLEPISGTYLKVKNLEKVVAELSKIKDSKKTAQKLKKHCHVCALGACFLSSVALVNDWDFSELWTDVDKPSWDRGYTEYDMEKKLSKIFSKTQMAMIEAAFERGECGYFNDSLSYKGKSHKRCAAFGERFPNPKIRLREIMQNIIDNGGTFKP